MHLLNIGSQILNLDVLADAKLLGDKVSLTFIDETESYKYAGDKAAKLWDYLSQRADSLDDHLTTGTKLDNVKEELKNIKSWVNTIYELTDDDGASGVESELSLLSQHLDFLIRQFEEV